MAVKIIDEHDGWIVSFSEYCCEDCARTDSRYAGEQEDFESSDGFCANCGVYLGNMSPPGVAEDAVAETMAWLASPEKFDEYDIEDVIADFDRFVTRDEVTIHVNDPDEHVTTCAAWYMKRFGWSALAEDYVLSRNQEGAGFFSREVRGEDEKKRLQTLQEDAASDGTLPATTSGV